MRAWKRSLWVVAVSAGTLLGLAGGWARADEAAGSGSDPAATQPPVQPATQPAEDTTEKGLATKDDDRGLFGKDLEDPTGGLIWQMLAAVIVVVVLGVAAIIVVRKVLPKLTRPSGKSISVIETVYLSPRKAVHLMQVHGRRLLVASTRERISLLADVTDEMATDSDEAIP